MTQIHVFLKSNRLQHRQIYSVNNKVNRFLIKRPYGLIEPVE